MVDLKNISSRDLWYLVGLIVTDGSLSKDGRHINITSKYRSYLTNINRHFNFNITIGKKARGGEQEKKYYYLQLSSVSFYKFLASLGLTPNKSLTLGAIKVDNKFFTDFLRGVIDGDGSISTWVHSGNGGRQWSLRIITGSKKFADWIKDEIEECYHVEGKVHTLLRKDRNNIHIIKFGKVAAQIILEKCYYKDCFGLESKKILAKRCLLSKNGWKRYKSMTSRGAGTGRQSRLKIE